MHILRYISISIAQARTRKALALQMRQLAALDDRMLDDIGLTSAGRDVLLDSPVIWQVKPRTARRAPLATARHAL